MSATTLAARSAATVALILAATSAALAQNYQINGCPFTPSAGITCVQSGGANLAAKFYNDAWTTFIGANPQYGFSYGNVGSTAGDLAVVNNASGLLAFGTSPTYPVHFTTTDNTADAVPDQVRGGVSYKGTASFVGAGKPLPSGGQMIQIVGLMTPMTIPLKNPKVIANNSVVLTDNDLCGIFSGKLTNWNQTSAKVKLTAGPIRVYYRTDGAGSTFLLTKHLAAVCTTGATGNSNIVFTPAQTFATLFGGTVPANFVGRSGSQAIADAVNTDASNAGAGSAISYVSPNFTSIASSPATPGSGNPPYSGLFVAGLKNGTSGRNFLPNVAGVQTALRNPGATASNTRPPATLALAQVQTNWVPVIPNPADGYPIVGSNNITLVTCYSDTNVSSGLISFLTNLYNGTYNPTLNANGFVQVSSLNTSYSGAIFKTFLSNGKQADGTKWNLNVNGPSCIASITRR